MVFSLLGTWGGVYAYGRLVTMTEQLLNHTLCWMKESKGEEQERNETEFLHFNEWEPNRSEERNAKTHADSTQ